VQARGGRPGLFVLCAGKGAMKLIVAIVQDKHAGQAVDGLIARGYGATRINTVGGFLRRGNATLLIGVEDAAVTDVLHLLRDTCGAPTLDADGTRTSGVAFVLPVGASWRF
jgi:uncharacterized protein YaaQ